jgi:hypothetical protein
MVRVAGALSYKSRGRGNGGTEGLPFPFSSKHESAMSEIDPKHSHDFYAHRAEVVKAIERSLAREAAKKRKKKKA